MSDREEPKKPEPRAMDLEGYAGALEGHKKLYLYRCTECGNVRRAPFLDRPVCDHSEEDHRED